MAKCTKCGKKAGFMLSICAACTDPTYDESLTRAASEGSQPVQESYRGVAGWLKFFCVVLMLNPIFTLVTPIDEVDSIKKVPWFYWTDRNLRIPVILGIIFSIGLAVFSAYAGYALFTRSDRRAVTVAKAFLLSVLVSKFAVTVMVFALLNSWRHVSPAHVDAITTPYLWVCIGTVVGVVAWWTYLNSSKRVRATYVE